MEGNERSRQEGPLTDKVMLMDFFKKLGSIKSLRRRGAKLFGTPQFKGV